MHFKQTVRTFEHVLNVNREEKAQHGTAATAWTRPISQVLSPSQSEKKKLDSSPSHQKMDSSLSPYSSHTALKISVKCLTDVLLRS